MLDEVERTMVHANPTEDLRMVLGDFALPALRRLERALDEHRMVTHCYVNGRGQGCVMYWLSGVTSKGELLAYPFSSEALWWAARRVVRWFDNGRLTLAMIRQVLSEELERRLEKQPVIEFKEELVEAGV